MHPHPDASTTPTLRLLLPRRPQLLLPPPPHHHLQHLVAALLCLLLFAFTAPPPSVTAIHIAGTFRPQHEFFKFLVKFGFQQTERHAQSDTLGYIYGNVTSPDAFAVPLTLAVLDRQQFLSLYDNRYIYDKNYACRLMFSGLELSSYDAHCNPTARGDYLRRVPCPHGRLCVDEDNAAHVVPGSQLTYVISNLLEPR